MNRRSFIHTSLSATAATLTMPPLQANNTVQPDSEPSVEWAKNLKNVASERHGELRKSNAIQRATDKRPNILLIYTDQQTLTALSCADYSQSESNASKAFRGKSLRPFIEGIGSADWRSFLVIPIDLSPERPNEIGRAVIRSDGGNTPFILEALTLRHSTISTAIRAKHTIALPMNLKFAKQ